MCQFKPPACSCKRAPLQGRPVNRARLAERHKRHERQQQASGIDVVCDTEVVTLQLRQRASLPCAAPQAVRQLPPVGTGTALLTASAWKYRDSYFLPLP